MVIGLVCFLYVLFLSLREGLIVYSQMDNTQLLSKLL